MSNYDVFLSYTRADAAAAEKLRTRLAETGLRAFLDRYALPAGQPWQPQLEAALAGCRALVVLLGPSGLGGWQQREIQLGVDRQATAGTTAPFSLIPVLLPGLQKDDCPAGPISPWTAGRFCNGCLGGGAGSMSQGLRVLVLAYRECLKPCYERTKHAAKEKTKSPWLIRDCHRRSLAARHGRLRRFQQSVPMHRRTPQERPHPPLLLRLASIIRRVAL
jgi:hypothetical protein